LLGLAYWYVVLPLHTVVFGRMLDGIRRAAEAVAASRSLTPSPPAADRLA
jgi:hypothetical protein